MVVRSWVDSRGRSKMADMAKGIVLNNDNGCCNSLTEEVDEKTRPAEPYSVNEDAPKCQGKQANDAYKTLFQQ